MRFVPNKWKIPRSFARHPNGKGIVAETDVAIHRRGRLKAKVLVFDSTKSMRTFWRKAMGNDLGRYCLGAVNAMAVESENTVTGRKRMRGDAKYFCIVGLCLGCLSTEIVCHEAVHAGYCYEKRVRRNLFGNVADFDEERIAYPTGRIAVEINNFLYRKKLYDLKPAKKR